MLKELMKDIRKNIVISSGLYILFGLVLLIWPAITMGVLCYASAFFACAYGAYQILEYVRDRNVRVFTQTSLVSGILTLGLGVLLFFQPEILLLALPVLLGIAILYEGVIKIQIAFDIRRVGYGQWWVMMILAALSVALGIIMLLDPFGAATTLIVLMGVAFVADGVLSLLGTWTISRKIKKLKDQFMRTHRPMN